MVLQSAAWGRLEQLGRDTRQRLRTVPEKRVTVFILGCQRSGTTMLMDSFDRDPQARIFGEFSRLNGFNPGLRRLWPQNTKRFDIRMRPVAEVARVIAGVRYPLVVSKPLVESQHAVALLEAVPSSSAVWVFRDYRDVAASNVRKFGAASAVADLAPVVAGDTANWRAEFVPDDVGALIARHYRPDMSPYDAGALFWYLRTRLYFDLGLDAHPRVLPLRYEALVADADRWLAEIYRHVGAEWPGPVVSEDIHTASVGRAADVTLSPQVGAACEQLWTKLCTMWDSYAAPVTEG